MYSVNRMKRIRIRRFLLLLLSGVSQANQFWYSSIIYNVNSFSLLIRLDKPMPCRPMLPLRLAGVRSVDPRDTCEHLFFGKSLNFWDSSQHPKMIKYTYWTKKWNVFHHKMKHVRTRRCTVVQSAVLRLHVAWLSVCLSVRPCVTLIDHYHTSRKSWKLSARSISPTPSLFLAQRPST